MINNGGDPKPGQERSRSSPVWLIAAPPLLDFDAAQRAFRPCWIPLTLAVVIMLAGLLRALAPLDVPWLER